MSITEQRLRDYQLQMSIYAEQHKILLTSDVIDMIEQLQDDLEDDRDKVVEQLEELKSNIPVNRVLDDIVNDKPKELGQLIAYDKAIEIVKQDAEKFGTDTNVGSNGWIPVEEELPETDKYILLSFSNFSIPCVGRYEEDENGGAFYIGDETESCVKQDMFVNAWMNLPTPYQPKGE